jgi:hypothetical protein
MANINRFANSDSVVCSGKIIKNRSALLPWVDKDIVLDPTFLIARSFFHHSAAFVFFETSNVRLR